MKVVPAKLKFKSTEEHLQHTQKLFLYSIYTQHLEFFYDFYLVSADVSKNVTFNIGFIRKNRKSKFAPGFN